MPDDLPDVVYVTRQDERNTPLRYSLRSLANLPHRRVIIAGHCPAWVQGVTHVPTRQRPNKFDSVEVNLIAALNDDDLTEHVIFFNDDFFVTEPIEAMPVLHGGRAADYKPINEMGHRHRKTLRLLGHGDHLRYDGTHVPLPVHVETARRILSEIPRGVLWRTWYGNRAEIGGALTRDVKSRDGRVIPGPFMSCSPQGIHTLKHHLEEILPGGCPYVRTSTRVNAVS